MIASPAAMRNCSRTRSTPGDLLGDRVFNLQPSVDLEEADGAIHANEELAGAGALVVRLFEDRDARLDQHRVLSVRQERRGGFLDELLVPTLQRAVARRDHENVPVAVREALGLHVPRLVEEAFNEALSAAERGERLARGRIEELWDFLDGAGDLEAATAAAEGRLDGNWQTILLSKGDYLVGRLNGVRGAGHQRCARALRDVTGADLVAKRVDRGGARANPGEARVDDGARKVRVFREEAVSGVNGLGAGALRNVDELGDVEVGVAGGCAAERKCLIREANVRGVAIGIRVDGDGREPRVFAGADDANCDLSAVGDEHRSEGSHRATVAPGICGARTGR